MQLELLQMKAYGEELALARKNLALKPPRASFIPSYRQYDLNELKSDLNDLQAGIAANPGSLDEAQQKEIRYLIAETKKHHQEIKLIYRDLKHSLSQKNVEDDKSIQKDKDREQEHAQLAKNLLSDLKVLKAGVLDILAASKEPLPDCAYDGYESDPEHSYTSAQLQEYISSYQVVDPEIQW